MKQSKVIYIVRESDLPTLSTLAPVNKER